MTKPLPITSLKRPPLKRLTFPLTIFLVFWIIAIIFWLWKKDIFFLANFGFIGTSVATGATLYTFLPKNKKPIGRKVAQFLVGGYMFGLLGFAGSENMQLEGFFFYLFSGLFAGSVIHYTIAKIIGPLIFNRGWCGWACWTAMILDLLPYQRSRGWVPGKLRWMRYAHFILSLGLVLVLMFGFGYRLNDKMTSLAWLLAGNILYFVIAIAMAFHFEDNRAFCKYLCPVTVLLKTTSRFSLMRVTGDAEACNACRVCERVCPMNNRIMEYIKAGQRVLSTECIVCKTCMSACPTGTLRFSFGFDAATKDLLLEKENK